MLYHLSYSHSFKNVVKGRTPRAALLRLALCLSGDEDDEDIYWDGGKPKSVPLGQIDPGISFWAGDDQMYQVRGITKVKPEIVTCPECNGSGKVNGFVPVDQGDSVIISSNALYFRQV